MRICLLFFIAIIFPLLGCGPTGVENCPPGVECAKITLYNQADPNSEFDWFDFSEGRTIIESEGHDQGDFALYKTFIRVSWPVVVGVMDTQADSLHRKTMSPTSGYEYPDEVKKNLDIGIYSGHVYYFITAEGHYAKLKVLNSEWNDNATSYNFITFEYAYQPDGTPLFGVNEDGSPVLREDEEVEEDEQSGD